MLGVGCWTFDSIVSRRYARKRVFSVVACFLLTLFARGMAWIINTVTDDLLEHLQQHEEAIADIYDVFRDQGITPIKALALALDLEKSMIERDFFCVFESDSPIIRKEFTALREHTLTHQRMLQYMFDNEKRKQIA